MPSGRGTWSQYWTKSLIGDQVNLAKAQLAQAAANLTKMINGSRPQEIDQGRAQVAQAQANVENADLTYQRENELRRTNAIS